MHRILIVGMLPSINGVSTSIMNLYRHLDRSRFQWDFLIEKKHQGKKNLLIEQIKSLGGHVYYLNHTKTDIPRHSRKAFRELLSSIPDLQGVHVHDLGHNTYPLYCASQMGLPIKVIQYHTAKSKTETRSLPPTRPFDSKLRQIAGDGFDRFACSDLSGVFAYGKLPFQVLPNGVDTRRFSFNPLYRTLLRRQLGIPENAPVLGFIGNLFSVKNPLFAVKVFREFRKLRPDAHMIVNGGGTMVKEMLECIKKERQVKRVHMLGIQTEIDMFLSAMDLAVCPSLSEGLPNAMVEAQAAGLSCLISDEVTDMVRLTPLVTMASLRESPRRWAETANQILREAAPRRSWGSEIKAAGYDIRDVAASLMALYQRRIDEYKKPQ